MGMQPILPVTLPFKKIKGAACQRYGDSNGVIQCALFLFIFNDQLDVRNEIQRVSKMWEMHFWAFKTFQGP